MAKEEEQQAMSAAPTAASNENSSPALAAERTEEEKIALKAAREVKTLEKARLKAEKNAKKALQAAARQTTEVFEEVTYLNHSEQEFYPTMGDYSRIMSRQSTGRYFCNVADLGKKHEPGDLVWLRGRLHSIRIKGGTCFLILRQQNYHTVQATFIKKEENDPEWAKRMIKYIKSLTLESVIDIEGTLLEASVKSCTIQDVEVQITRIHSVSKADARLPFSVEDAGRSEAEIEASKETDTPYPSIGQDVRLDHRWIDLRAPANNAIMRIQSAICQLFRESLYSQGFCEIHTPKLIAGESESGAGVFLTDYFGSQACLAQSPQLYKQMAISSDMNRVFEVAPVFRAEDSNTTRHLCEFTGLDLEMAISEHYVETLEVIHTMFKHIFNGLESRWAKELAVIRGQYASEPVTFTEKPCLLHWPEAITILKEAGFEVGDGLQDLNGVQELALGKAVKENYGTDFFMLDKYPSTVRPFYSMPDPENPAFSNSYDIFLRGQEICSGAQRCHDADLLVEQKAQKGIAMGDGLKKYVESFRHGVSPHAGAGIGLERVVFLYLGLDNIRKASMFPRDPRRCLP